MSCWGVFPMTDDQIIWLFAITMGPWLLIWLAGALYFTYKAVRQRPADQRRLPVGGRS